MDVAQNILVIKTSSGMANAAAAALDHMNLQEIVGSLAGDDTIACFSKSTEDTMILMNKIEKNHSCIKEKGECSEMLVHLHVKNLALIEEAEVDFQDGLNILTENRYGKYTLIGSVNLALGQKMSRGIIREGAEMP